MCVFGIYMCTKGTGVNFVFILQWNLGEFADVAFICDPSASL